MIRFLVLSIVAYILYKLVTNEIRRRNSGSGAAPPPAGQKTATGDMVKDPVCGTYVDAASSVSIRDGETIHRFCGYECRDTFLQGLKQEGRKIPDSPPPKDTSHTRE